MKKIKVLIQPVGIVSWEILEELTFNLNSKLEIFTAEISKYTIEVPTESYNPIRNQFYSPIILNKICRETMGYPHDRILGVTDIDLYVEGLNFIFGEAQFNGKCAIISLTRLRPEFYGEPPDPALFQERVLKEAVHELGHTLGLRHCTNRKCVMYFSNSIWDTDAKTYQYCNKCRGKLMKKLTELTY